MRYSNILNANVFSDLPFQPFFLEATVDSEWSVEPS
jgi:hypothetical protein